MKYTAQTTCDNGLGELQLIEGQGDTESQAMDCLAEALHQFMFDEPVDDEFENGAEFLNECKNFFVTDPNAATSVAIWTALQDAVGRIVCVENLDD